MDTVEKECAKKYFKRVGRPSSRKNSKSNDNVDNSLPRRLCTNQPNGHHHAVPGLKPQILKPRISKLENLEAKMASIEVSLSETQLNQNQLQQQKTSQFSRQIGVLHDSNYLHQSNAIYFSSSAMNGSGAVDEHPDAASAKVPRNATEMSYLMDEVEKLRNRLEEKDAIICSLKEQTNHFVSTTNQNTTTVTQTANGANQYVNLNCLWTIDTMSKEYQMKEERTVLIQKQIDNKSIIIKNLKMKLEGLEVKDLDSRIRQAELECLMEKEEMKILNLKQELMNFKANNEKSISNGNHYQPMLSSGDELTLYSVVVNSNCTSLFAFDTLYDSSSPCLYVTTRHCGKGLIVQWAKENSKLKKGDRLLEVNGQTVVNCSKVEFLDMLKSTNVLQLKLVIIRNMPMLPARKTSTKEVDTLKEEMSSIVNKLDNKIKENRELLLSSQNLRKEITRLKSDNQRLHHRTFYLEDQVSELLSSHQPEVETKHANTISVSCDDNSSFRDCMAIDTQVSSIVSNGSVNSSSYDQQTNNTPRLLKCSTLKHSQSNNSIQILSPNNAEHRHHVLQVKIPFSNADHNSIVNCNRPYMNVPMSHRLSEGLNSDVKDPNFKLQRIHGPYAGADSDSGNYSGDSMDDTRHTSAPKLMTGFVVQRQVPQQLNTITVTPLCTSSEMRVANNCYMNVHPNRKLMVMNESEENKTVKLLQANSSKKTGRLSSRSSGLIRLLNDDSKSKDGQEIEVEEWC